MNPPAKATGSRFHWCMLAALLFATPLRVLASEALDPWAEYPARETERPLLPLERGLEARFNFSSLSTDRRFGDDGKLEEIKGSYNLLRAEVEIAYGLHDRWEVSAGLPYLTGKIEKASGGALGDPFAGTRALVVSRPSFDLALGVSVSFPYGDSDYHYEHGGAGAGLENLRTGDPGVDYRIRAEGKFKSERLSVYFSVAQVLTGEGEVEVTYAGGSGEDVLVNPGDGLVSSLAFSYQAGERWVPGVSLFYETFSETEFDHKGMGDERQLLAVIPSILLQATPEFDAAISLSCPLSGKNEPHGFPVVIFMKTRF